MRPAHRVQALQYIFHKSGYRFPKGAVSRQFTREVAGPGIIFAQGTSILRVLEGRSGSCRAQ